MSGLFEHVINYCERTDASFWSEPVNALSNIAFFIAAWTAHNKYRQSNIQSRPVSLLIAIIAIVGAGSFIFHTFATNLAMLFDIIPIVGFVGYYIYVSFTWLLGWKPLKAIILIILFIAFGGYADGIAPPYNLNGSIAYLPCLGIILYIWFRLNAAGNQVHTVFRTAALYFAISLTFRTIDMQVCSSLHLGTHFLWHCLNGFVLYLLVKALIQSAKTAN